MRDVPLDASKPDQLAQLLDMSTCVGATWSRGELAAILRHQLDGNFADFGNNANSGPVGCSTRLEDLLRDASPPLESLSAIKAAAKSLRNDPQSCFPDEVATWIYFVAIAAALVRCDARISELSAQSLRDGFAWCRDQSWSDAGFQQLLDAAASRAG